MKKTFILIGAALQGAGCFLPVITLPDSTLNFFDPIPVNIPGIPPDAMQYAGISIIASGTISIVLALINRTKFLWTSGIATGAILAAVYWGFHTKLEEMKAQADQQMNNLFGGLFQGITDSLFQAVELRGTGWYVISFGALLLVLSSVIKRNTATLKHNTNIQPTSNGNS